MNKLKAFLGYFWAALAVPVILIMLLGSNAWVDLISASGLQVSPWFTGGEVAQTLTSTELKTEIHAPVFQALIGERKQGFVQVNWSPLKDPFTMIDEEIDYDSDGVADFGIVWNVQASDPVIIPYSPFVLGLDSDYHFKDGSVAVRVKLRNKK